MTPEQKVMNDMMESFKDTLRDFNDARDIFRKSVSQELVSVKNQMETITTQLDTMNKNVILWEEKLEKVTAEIQLFNNIKDKGNFVLWLGKRVIIIGSAVAATIIFIKDHIKFH
jgi:hypothetical protein